MKTRRRTNAQLARELEMTRRELDKVKDQLLDTRDSAYRQSVRASSAERNADVWFVLAALFGCGVAALTLAVLL